MVPQLRQAWAGASENGCSDRSPVASSKLVLIRIPSFQKVWLEPTTQRPKEPKGHSRAGAAWLLPVKGNQK